MRLARFARGGSIALLGGVIGSAGCTHNYYYGNAPLCPPSTTVVPGAVQYGASCDVPTQVIGGSVASQASPPSTTLSGSMPPRVVVSQPSNGARASPARAPTPTAASPPPASKAPSTTRRSPSNPDFSHGSRPLEITVRDPRGAERRLSPLPRRPLVP